MSTSDGVGFDKLPILAELRDRLNEHYLARAPGPQKHPWLVRSRRWRPLALIAVLLLAGVTTGALAAAGVFQSPAVIERYNQSITPAVMRAMNSPLCARREVPATTTSTAPASLLSILGVLRRPARPGGVSDVVSKLSTPGQSLYVRYVRFARSVDGFDVYVSVGTSPVLTPVNIGRCIAAATASFDRELSRIPKTLRADDKQIFNYTISTQRINWARNKPLVAASARAFSIYSLDQGGFGGGGTAAEIEKGLGLGFGGAATGLGPNTSFVAGVVPDGVASVTLHYLAGPLGGYSTKHVPAANITTKPVNNVIVAIVPRPTGNAQPSTMTWRAANGTIIKTLRESS